MCQCLATPSCLPFQNLCTVEVGITVPSQTTEHNLQEVSFPKTIQPFYTPKLTLFCCKQPTWCTTSLVPRPFLYGRALPIQEGSGNQTSVQRHFKFGLHSSNSSPAPSCSNQSIDTVWLEIFARILIWRIGEFLTKSPNLIPPKFFYLRCSGGYC